MHIKECMYLSVCSLKKSNETDSSVTTAHVINKDTVVRTLEMPVYLTPPHLQIAMILDLGLTIPFAVLGLYVFLETVLLNFAVFEIYMNGIHACCVTFCFIDSSRLIFMAVFHSFSFLYYSP